MTILQRSPSLRHYLRSMASHPRFVSPSLHRHCSSLSSPPFSSSTPRVKFQFANVLNLRLMQRNVITMRSFMSSTLSTEAFQESAASIGYGSEQIQVYEILDNAIDEAQAGYATKVDVILHQDGSVSIKDNGRGISLHGGQVLSWKTDKGDDLLFTSSKVHKLGFVKIL